MDKCHESFIMNRRGWIIFGTQVLSQSRSDLTRSIYTLSLWIRPRECHTAAQSTLLLLHPLTNHPSVCTIITHTRELSATHGNIKMTASEKWPQVRMTQRPSSSSLMRSWALAQAPLWPERLSEGKMSLYSDALKKGQRGPGQRW